jgi:hypothetical protein
LQSEWTKKKEEEEEKKKKGGGEGKGTNNLSFCKM